MILLILNNAALGIVVSLFLKRLNSILKTFASALELMFTAVLSWYAHGVHAGPPAAGGLIVTLCPSARLFFGIVVDFRTWIAISLVSGASSLCCTRLAFWELAAGLAWLGLAPRPPLPTRVCRPQCRCTFTRSSPWPRPPRRPSCPCASRQAHHSHLSAVVSLGRPPAGLDATYIQNVVFFVKNTDA